MRYAIYDKNTNIIDRIVVVYGQNINDQLDEENESVISVDGSFVMEKGKKYMVDNDGNIAEYAPPPPPADEIKRRKVKSVEMAIQKLLDAKARECGYDGIVSASSYAGFENPFQAEGQAFLSWRGAVWKYCYDQLAKIESGEREEPTLEEFLGELPAYTPPS